MAALAATMALWAAPSESDTRKAIVETAQTFKGVPYVYGEPNRRKPSTVQASSNTCIPMRPT